MKPAEEILCWPLLLTLVIKIIQAKIAVAGIRMAWLAVGWASKELCQRIVRRRCRAGVLGLRIAGSCAARAVSPSSTPNVPEGAGCWSSSQ